jgi:hypothetical protein
MPSPTLRRRAILKKEQRMSRFGPRISNWSSQQSRMHLHGCKGGGTAWALHMPEYDEKTVFSDILARQAARAFVPKPILAGNNNEDGPLHHVFPTLITNLTF